MRIIFEQSSHQISNEDHLFLSSLAANARSYDQYRIVVVGHLLQENPGEEVVSLAKKRVNAVVETLISMGLPADRIDCEHRKGESAGIDAVQLLVFKLHAQLITH